MTRLVPYLVCRNAPEAIDFYVRAFGAEERFVARGPDGKILNAQLAIDGAPIYLMEEMPEHGARGPLTLGGTPLHLALEVDDCDALFARAVAAGAEIVMSLEDMFWGQRWGLVRDPYGFTWSIATQQREVSMEEIEKAMSTTGA